MNRIDELLMGNDVVSIARKLIGMELFTRIDGSETSGLIIETEAYAGVNDRASHAYGGKRTVRTETMFAESGTAYIYLCYGMHHLFNIVTGPKETPHAVLLRGILPLVGEEVMRQRSQVSKGKLKTDGPGKAAKALGLQVQFNGQKLDNVWCGLRLPNIEIPDTSILSGPRIGVDYAGTDALLPYRFYLKPGSINV